MSVVLVTGGFDPIHSGHIEYIKAAKKLGEVLVIGLNSDEWLARKKGKPFMSWQERAAVLAELSSVDHVISFNDSDNTANDAIYKCLKKFPHSKLIFANGGDRTATTTPEYNIYGKTYYVQFVFGVGGLDKKNSSSWLLDSWTRQKTLRDWGYWRVLEDKQPQLGIKVKELVIKQGCSLSNQRHFYRNEHWYVLTGTLQIVTEYNSCINSITLTPNSSYIIGRSVWHQAKNIGEGDVQVIEIQYGDKCEESDIERRDN